MSVCRLRIAFIQSATGQGTTATPATLLGHACHAVLDDLVKGGGLWRVGWELSIDSLWESALGVELGREPSAAGWGAPERWPGYQIKRARLRRLATHLKGLLDDLPDEPEIRAEQTIVGLEGRLFGRLDLAVRGARSHFIVDYKSGSITDAAGEIRPNYQRQLQLYAALEAEDSGSWPTAAYLLPLDGPPMEVVIDPSECRRLALDAVRVLEEFNRRAPGQQPANAAEETCSNCRFSARCSAFWAACSPSWADTILAVAGPITRRTEGLLGGVSLQVVREAGSLSEEVVEIRGIPIAEHPAAHRSASGLNVGIVGLRPEADRGTFAMLRSGQLWTEDPPTIPVDAN
jgi:CRISPR/Cas system-associated exonuclease Cas4 (RecB family)